MVSNLKPEKHPPPALFIYGSGTHPCGDLIFVIAYRRALFGLHSAPFIKPQIINLKPEPIHNRQRDGFELASTQLSGALQLSFRWPPALRWNAWLRFEF